MAMAGLIIPSLVALVLLTVPGVIATLASGVRGPFALFLSPIISVSLFAISAILVSLTGLRWNVYTAWLPIAAILLLLLLVRLGGNFVRRWFARRRSAAAAVPDLASSAEAAPTLPAAAPAAPATPGEGWQLRPLAALAAATFVSLLLWTLHLHQVLRVPGAISQTFDNIYHLSALRYILDSGQASSLHMGSLGTGNSVLAFYPAAWHDIASQVALLTGCSVPVATNALAFAVASWAWLCSLFALIWVTTSRSTAIILATGVLSASFANFPLELLDFGVLYPNMLGIAIVGQLAALTYLLFTGKYGDYMPLSSVLALGLLGGIGLGLSHPNAILLFTILALAILLGVCVHALARAFRGGARRVGAALGWVVLVAVAIAAANFLWETARPPFDGWQWLPYQSTPQAFGELVLHAGYYYQPAWLLAVLSWVGLVCALRSSRQRWFVFAALALGYLYILASAGPNDEHRFFLIWPWYSDPARFAAQMPLATAPLALIGFDATCRAVNARLSALNPRLGETLPALVTSLALVLALAYGTQTSRHLVEGVNRAEVNYRLDDHSQLLSVDEMRVLEDVERLTPKDAVIITDPWNGSSLAYALTGRKTTTLAPLYTLSPEMQLLSQHLADLKHDERVCPALDRLHARYVLAFGDPEINGSEHDWPGLDWLQISSGFKVISRHGDAALLEITGCK
ncbi:DUF6541 family protein [Dermabacteraceae bacterium P13077]